jgi:hypothetical protein
VNLLAHDIRTRSTRDDFRAAIDIPTPHRLLFRHAAPGEIFGSAYGSFAKFDTLAAANALAIRQPQAQSAFVFLQAKRRCGADLDQLLCDGWCQTVRQDFRHAATVAVPKQGFHGDQPVWMAQALPNDVADHRSHPEYERLKLLLISGKSAMMFPSTAKGMAGQFWNDGDLT